MSRLFTCAILSLFCCINATSQTLTPIFRGKDFTTPFIDAKGKLVFSLPKGHSPVVGEPSTGIFFSFLNIGYNQPMQVFYDGVCVVRSDKGAYYWINDKGETIKDFGDQYAAMGQFEAGLCKALFRIQDKQGFYIAFLNPQGENVFGEKIFWEATPFINGVAAVQEENEEAPWYFIDKNGKATITIQVPNDYQIIKVELLENNTAQLMIKHRKKKQYDYLFVNTLGEKRFQVSEKFPGKKVNFIGQFSQGLCPIAFARSGDIFSDVFWVNEKGETQFSFKSINKYGPKFHSGYTFIEEASDAEGNSYKSSYSLVDTKGNKHKPTLPDGEVILSLIEMDGRYAKVQVSDGRSYVHCLIDLQDSLSMKFCTKQGINGWTDRSDILYFDGNRSTHTLKDLSGKTIWETPIEELVFSDIKEALKYKDKVRLYELRNPDDFKNGLFKLKKLQYLSIEYNDLKTLPTDIYKLKELESLKLYSLDKFETLPAETARLEKLQTLNISSCPNYKSGVEYVIENAPALKLVTLDNIELKDGFETMMKQKRPELVINAWYSSEIMIQEDPVIIGD